MIHSSQSSIPFHPTSSPPSRPSNTSPNWVTPSSKSCPDIRGARASAAQSPFGDPGNPSRRAGESVSRGESVGLCGDRASRLFGVKDENEGDRVLMRNLRRTVPYLYLLEVHYRLNPLALTSSFLGSVTASSEISSHVYVLRYLSAPRSPSVVVVVVVFFGDLRDLRVHGSDWIAKGPANEVGLELYGAWCLHVFCSVCSEKRQCECCGLCHVFVCFLISLSKCTNCLCCCLCL